MSRKRWPPTLMLAVALTPTSAARPPSEEASAARPLGIFSGHGDVGDPSIAGSVAFDPETGEYVVTGSGGNMWSDRDEFHFVWRRLRGDFILRARARFLGEGAHPHRKMGWIVRSGLEPDATYVDAAVHGDGLAALQFRRVAGGETEEIRSEVVRPDVIQLSRTGRSFSLAVAPAGEPLERVSLADLDLGDEVFVGLFVCSHDAEAAEQASFHNVRIVVPAPPDLVPYQDYLASNLEVLDLATGRRTIVHQTPDSMQAPNWAPDGKTLIYNRNGLLYRFDLETRTTQVLDTGFADRNNNDHVLSFDGKMLGISHHDPASDDRSIIYTLPADGGTPQRVTPGGPSYLHGWSPDGRFLVYTAERDGDYDIYRIPADGGEETRLTSSIGLDDGSEYSPDGRWIYFNSVRSGTMELWRMKPDGGDPEQLTDDRFNNWFPHPSPDGKSIVFLSYGTDVEPSDHPFYREVYLRLMPAEGGEPRVIAYLYGGQGTINVPSWAPDGRRLAFVSNTADPLDQAADAEDEIVSTAGSRQPARTIGDIERLDPAIDSLIPRDAVIEVLAEGFVWSEGPVWVADGGFLLFSDVPQNKIFAWREGEGARQWLEPSGYTGTEPRGGEPGSNGLLLDSQGRLVMCQHGDRRVARLETPLDAPRPDFTTLADRYDGKRFSSPNDAAFDRAGNLYFTDPPYGLPEGPDDPSREMPVHGVYRLGTDGRVTLLTDTLSRPNGIALSPDERTLYVANSDPERAVWMAYDLRPDGRIGNGRVFFDATEWVGRRPGLPDGLKVDRQGNLFATGPGGVLVFAPDGRHLGTIRTTQATANCAFDEGGATLFMTADSYLLRLRLAE